MISVIVSIYKKLDNLELIFLGLARQSFKDFEVIVAEDDNSSNTIAFLEEAKQKYSFPIQHVSQEDKGFRKCRILNKALLVSKGEKIVFLDGDCIPHTHFLKAYNKNIKNNISCCGRRVMLSSKLTDKIKQNKKLYVSLWYLIQSHSYPIKRGIYLPFFNKIKNNYGILGCNWGIMKTDILSINGFDMDYEIIGIGEDIDLEWRFKAKGIQRKKVTNSCIVYHLYHVERYNDSIIAPNIKMLKEKTLQGNFFCKNGISLIP